MLKTRQFSLVKSPALSRASSSSTIISIPKADIYSFGATRDRPIFTDVEWTVRDKESWAIVGTGSGEKNLLFQTLLGHFRISPYPPGALFPFLKTQDPTSAITTVSFTHRPRSSTNTDFYDYSARYGAVHEEDKITLRQSLYTSLGIANDPFSKDTTPEEHRMSEEDKRLLHDLAESMGLSPFMDLPIIALSNGQTRRARILRAVLRKPKVELLILDEPLTGLDIQTRPKLLSLLHELHASASPRILLGLRTHDDIPTWITNVALVGGRRVISGTRDEYLQGKLADSKYKLFGTGGSKGVGIGLGVGKEGKRYGIGKIREFVEGGEEERWRIQRMWEVLTSLGPGAWVSHPDVKTARAKAEEFSKRPFVSLSVGEQRMVLLMRALVARPRLLLLDEVWSGMDEGMLRAARSYLRGDGTLEGTGVDDEQAVVLITHWEQEVPWRKDDGLKTFRLVNGEGREVL
uniref:Putative P-loop containing nucleoside triphosphate hydrolase protein n=1 Tax=Moniliophthora roreri TaxID=221103 RepID=A0A0W0EXS4_MONRR